MERVTNELKLREYNYECPNALIPRESLAFWRAFSVKYPQTPIPHISSSGAWIFFRWSKLDCQVFVDEIGSPPTWKAVFRLDGNNNKKYYLPDQMDSCVDAVATHLSIKV